AIISTTAKPFSEDSDYSYSKPAVSISPLIGFNFAETFSTDFGKVYLNQGQYYGVNLGFRPSSWHEYELSWFHQVTLAEANVYYYNGFNNIVSNYVTGDLAIDYFMVGMNGIKDLSDRFKAYSGISGGLVVFTPRDYNIEAVARFSVALKIGIQANITDNIGIRLQPQLFVPIQAIGADVFVSNQGSGIGVSGYSTITQFGGNAGVTISF
ncbi:MAG: hypothetical protein ACKOA1_11215, partial [Bacteroidota bacterium]